ncbi:MAG TPA: hypothetical protein V6C78_20745 [Crinalium sp.]|jgi:hypothetical protein
MSHPVLYPKLATRSSWWAGAIAGSLFATSLLPPSALSVESQVAQIVSARPQVTETTTVNRVAVMAIAFGGAVGVCLGLNLILDRKRPRSASRRVEAGSSPQSKYAVTVNQINHSLRHKLLLLLRQDVGAANRLLTQASFKYPGKSANWYAEKVLYDLRRDYGKI